MSIAQDRHQEDVRREGRAEGIVRPWLRPAEVEDETQLARRYGRIAGVLFILVTVLSVPSSLLLDPTPWLPVSIVSLLGVGTGLVCLAVPWQRISPAWLHLLPAMGTVQVAVAVGTIDSTYGSNYFFIALFVGFVFQSRRAIAAHLGLVSLALVAPIVYDPGSTFQLRLVLLRIPAVVLSGVVVAYLRERLEANQRAYRRFAEEAFEIAVRIGGEEALEAAGATAAQAARRGAQSRRV